MSRRYSCLRSLYGRLRTTFASPLLRHFFLGLGRHHDGRPAAPASPRARLIKRRCLRLFALTSSFGGAVSSCCCTACGPRVGGAAGSVLAALASEFPKRSRSAPKRNEAIGLARLLWALARRYALRTLRNTPKMPEDGGSPNPTGSTSVELARAGRHGKGARRGRSIPVGWISGSKATRAALWHRATASSPWRPSISSTSAMVRACFATNPRSAAREKPRQDRPQPWLVSGRPFARYRRYAPTRLAHALTQLGQSR